MNDPMDATTPTSGEIVEWLRHDDPRTFRLAVTSVQLSKALTLLDQANAADTTENDNEATQATSEDDTP